MKLVTFCMDQDILYTELELNDELYNKYYEIKNPNCEKMIAFPDGCIDVQICTKDKDVHIQFIGSINNAGEAMSSDFDKIAAVKLNPGQVPVIIKNWVDKVISNRIDITELFDKEELRWLVSDEATVDDRMDFFRRNFGKESISKQHELVESVINMINEHHGCINIEQMSSDLGYNHRYIDRIFKGATGFSIKKYANIVRLQEAIKIVDNNNNNDDDDLYNILGYYDQSHFIRDFKRFTTFTPRGFVKRDKKKRVV